MRGGVGAGGQRDLPELSAGPGVDLHQEPALVLAEAVAGVGAAASHQVDGVGGRAEQLRSVEDRPQVLEYAEGGVDLPGGRVDRGDAEWFGLVEGVVDGVDLRAVGGGAAHEVDGRVGPLGRSRRGVEALDAVFADEEEAVRCERGGRDERVGVADGLLPEQVPGGGRGGGGTGGRFRRGGVLPAEPGPGTGAGRRRTEDGAPAEGEEPAARRTGRRGRGCLAAAREGRGEGVLRWGGEALGRGMPDAADAAGDLREEGLGEVAGETVLPGAQQGGQLVGGGPAGGVLVEAAGQDRQQCRRDSGEVRFGVADAVHEVGVGAAAEGAVAGGRVGEDAGEGEHVARGCVFQSGGLLGGHEGGRAGGGAGAGEAVVAEGAGDTEVDDLGTLGGDHDVGGLEVAVDDVRGVQLGQRRAQQGPQGAHRGLGERSRGGDGLVEGRAEDVLGRHPGGFGERIGVEDAGAVDGADDAGRVDFEAEAGADGGIGRDVGVHRLQRRRPAGGRAGEVDGAHAAAAQAGEEAVAAECVRVVVRERGRHQGAVRSAGRGSSAARSPADWRARATTTGAGRGIGPSSNATSRCACGRRAGSRERQAVTGSRRKSGSSSRSGTV